MTCFVALEAACPSHMLYDVLNDLLLHDMEAFPGDVLNDLIYDANIVLYDQR